MFTLVQFRLVRLIAAAAVSTACIFLPARADTQEKRPATPSQDRYYRAYYLETVAGDYAEAARLYAEVAADPAADARLKGEAGNRLAGVKEELAAGDFARLMPPTAIA